jgi:hypothetical protein
MRYHLKHSPARCFTVYFHVQLIREVEGDATAASKRLDDLSHLLS